MHGVLGGGDVGGVHEGGLALHVVVLGHVFRESRVVGVVPVRIEGLGPPREVALDHRTVPKEIVRDGPLQPLVVPADQAEVVGRREEVLPLLVHLQLVLPGVVLLLFRDHVAEVVLEGLQLLPGHQSGDLLVLSRGLLHVEEGRQPVGRGVDVGVLVLGAVEVDAYQVEGVHELLAARVGAVVAVGPLVLVDHESPFRGSFRVGPPVVVSGGHIYAVQEGLDGLGDGIAAAEGADDSGLLGGVFLLGSRLALGDLDGAGVHRPLDDVAPVGVCGQHPVGVQRIAFPDLEDVLPVTRAGGPVHEAGRLVGRAVEHVDADVVGHPPGDRDVLLRGDLPGERDHQPVAGCRGRVAVGAVDAPGRAVEHVADGAQGGGFAVVDVEGDEGPGADGVGLALPSHDDASDEAADVLGLAPGGLVHGLVFCHGLLGPLALRETVHQGAPRGALLLPVLADP